MRWLSSALLPTSSSRHALRRTLLDTPTPSRVPGRRRHGTLVGPPTAENKATDEVETTADDGISDTELMDVQLLLSVIDLTDVGQVAEYFDFYRDPYLRRYASSDDRVLSISEKSTDRLFPSKEMSIGGDKDLFRRVQKLASLISLRLRGSGRRGAHVRPVSLSGIYRAYLDIPEPRMMNIPAMIRHALLRVNGTPMDKSSVAMLRYSALLEDVRLCGLSLTHEEWNYAMSLAMRYVKNCGRSEAGSVIRLWKDMELRSGIRGNQVTFNIIFNVASRTGNWTLAEKVLEEIEDRKLPLDRFHRVSLIHFFGLKRDSDGVRAAYKELIDSTEMIDTLALNCVIASFLRCGDEEPAHHVYKLMNGSFKPREGAAIDEEPTTTTSGLLKMFSKMSKKRPEMETILQRQVSIKPDRNTFQILIDYYAIKKGDLQQVATYLDEMKRYSMPLHGHIFLALFKGFAIHGGAPESAWSEKALEDVFDALEAALKSSANNLHISKWLAVWILKAFAVYKPQVGLVEVYGRVLELQDFDTRAIGLLDDVIAELTNVRRGGKGRTLRLETSNM